MTGSQTIRIAAREWLTGRDGIAHSQPVHGRERAACGAARQDPRFNRPDLRREFCSGCLDAEGITVPRPGRGPMTPVVNLDRVNPVLVDDVGYEAAIARRNTTWARWQDARAALAIARDEIGFHDLRPYIGAVNQAQDAYEEAHRALIRIRVCWRLGRAA